MADTSKLKDLLKKALAIVEALDGDSDGESSEETTKPVLPSLKALGKLDDEGILELAGAFGIEAKKAKLAKALLTTAASIVAEEDDIDEDDINALCEAIGIEPTEDDIDATKTAVTEFFSSEPAAPAPKKGKKPAADDDDDADDEAPAPKKGKKSAPAADDDDDDAGEDDDDEKPKAKKGKKAAADDDDDDDAGDDDGDEEDLGKFLKLHQKAHKKADYADGVEVASDEDELKDLLTDEKEKVAKWGTPYVKDGAGFCCGLPLLDVEDEENQGKCAVTGTVYEFNSKKRSFAEVD